MPIPPFPTKATRFYMYKLTRMTDRESQCHLLTCPQNLIPRYIYMAASSEFTTFHSLLKTTFHGIHHEKSYSDARVTQYRGVKFASILARWRRAQLFEAYKNHYDATKHGWVLVRTGMKPILYIVSEANSYETSQTSCNSIWTSCRHRRNPQWFA